MFYVNLYVHLIKITEGTSPGEDNVIDSTPEGLVRDGAVKGSSIVDDTDEEMVTLDPHNNQVRLNEARYENWTRVTKF